MYPALAVLQAAKQIDELNNKAQGILEHEGEQLAKESTLDVLWIGSEGGMEAELICRAGIPYDAIPAAGVHGVGIRSLPGNILQLARGFKKARTILHEYRPDVLFFTGGYVAVPMALAGIHLPSLLYVPDIEPGLALKSIARFADHIAVTVDESRTFFSNKKKISVTGYPTRPQISAWKKSEAYQALDLQPDLPVLLVFGGSKGARSINEALINILRELLNDMQVVHVSGKSNWPEIEGFRSSLHETISDQEIIGRYKAFPYLHEEMGAALSVADLVVSRAGASILGEFPLFGIPAVLVPYPFAWRYQRLNAEYLVERKAAIIIKDEDLSDQLLRKIRELIRDSNQRKEMSHAMRKLAKPDAALYLYQLLQNLVVKKAEKGSEL